MAQTENLTLTASWQEVATGAATVTCTARAPGAEYLLREDAGAPADTTQGHVFPLDRDVSMQLLAGTRLYAKGRAGVLAYSVDAE